MGNWKAPRTLVAVAVLATAGLVGAASLGEDEYEVTAVMPAGHPKLSEGTPVYIDGFPMGEITSIRPEDNEALLGLRLDDEAAPLHDGAVVRVRWKSLVGERMLIVEDGPAENAEIPNGGMVEGDNPTPMEVGDVLAAFDPETRKHLGSFVRRLQGTLGGHEADLRESLNSLGPALAALGEVTRAVGSDGPAIRSLVTSLDRLMATIDSRSVSTQGIVSELSRTANTIAAKRDRLREALARFPRTLETAELVLGEVPETTDLAVPLLHDLADATERLPATSGHLANLLRDLRPMVADLRPTLRAASVLLDHTPALMGSMHATLPDIGAAMEGYLPALEFLRPYTPEAVGFLTTWGAAAKNYDANGRYMRIHGQTGGSSFNGNPGIPLPGFSQDLTPEPGAPGGIPQDAEGEGMH